MKINHKKIIIAVLVLLCFFPRLAGAKAQEPHIEAQTAILIEPVSESILYAKEPYRRMYPASTTKILTALLAVETGDLDAQVTVGSEIYLVARGSSLARLGIGDTITLGDLVYGLLLPSGNDAAYTIAVYLARLQSGNPDLSAPEAIKVFAGMMNARARELGAKDTHFSGPDGFHAADHYTTAYDLSLIAREAMKHPFIRTVVATSNYTPESWKGNNTRSWKNNNQLLHPNNDYFYPDATGLKTGYTGQAGFCLVSSGSREALDLIAVCLNTSEDGRWSDAKALLDYGFANFTWLQLVQAEEEIQTVNISNSDWGQPDSVALTAAEGFAGVFAREAVKQIKKEIIIDNNLLDTKYSYGEAAAAVPAEYALRAPLVKGQVAGQVKFTLEGRELFSADLIVIADVDPRPWWRTGPALSFLGCGLFFLVSILVFRLKRRLKTKSAFRSGH